MCVHTGTHVYVQRHMGTCRGQKTTCGSNFPPLILFVMKSNSGQYPWCKHLYPENHLTSS